MALIDHSQGLDRARPSILGIRLIGMEPVDVHARDVDVRPTVDDPVRHHAPETAAGENADRVEARRDEVVLQLGRLADARLEIRHSENHLLFTVGSRQLVARLLDVNFSAVAAITTRLLPHLLTRPRATIVGFGSVAAARGRSKNVAYSAAKRALASFFESLRHACADTGVAVQFYVLGYMDTELAAGIRSPIPKGDPRALGDLILKNLDRDVGVVYYPWFWRALCAALRALPWALFKRSRF